MNIRAERRRLISQAKKVNLDYTKDIGINGGCPIFAWQENTIFTPAGEYEIGKNGGIEKTIELNLSSAGEIGFEIKPLKEPIIIRLLNKDMEVLDTSTIISATSNIVLDSTDETKVILYTTGRALVKIVDNSTTVAISTITEKKKELGILTSSIEHSYDLPEAWDGTLSESLTQIDGVYQIASGADLAKFSAIVNSGETTANAVLTADINLGGANWAPYTIGMTAHDSTDTTYAYTGTFDGQGHTIYNLTFSNNNTRQGGLFLFVNAGTIRNFKVKDADIKSKYNTGGSTSQLKTLTYTSVICGKLFGGGTIENVYTSGNMYEDENTSNSKMYGAGSIVGVLDGGTVENCYSDVTITCTHEYTTVDTNAEIGIGGIVGTTLNNNNTNRIVHCGFGGEISAPNLVRVGGVIGNIRTSSGTTVEACYNKGNITGYAAVAGVIGWGGAITLTQPAYNTGTIRACTENDNSTYLAGIANYVNHKSNDAHFIYNAGSVIIKTTDNADDSFSNAGKTNALLVNQKELISYKP